MTMLAKYCMCLSVVLHGRLVGLMQGSVSWCCRLEYATVAEDYVKVWSADTHIQHVEFAIGAGACCSCVAWHPGRPHLAVSWR